MPRVPEKPGRRAPVPDDQVLPKLRKTRGIAGVRRLAVGILQQQLESMRDRRLLPMDREFVIEAVKALVSGEKMMKAPGRGGEPPGLASGTPLPPLEAKT